MLTMIVLCFKLGMDGTHACQLNFGHYVNKLKMLIFDEIPILTYIGFQ